MDARLIKRCRIEYKSSTQDPDYGSEIPVWLPLAVVWAEVQDVLPSRSESVNRGLEVARNQSRVRIRYRSDVDSSMRLVIWRPGEIVYQIVGGPSESADRMFIEFVVEKYSS